MATATCKWTKWCNLQFSVCFWKSALWRSNSTTWCWVGVGAFSYWLVTHCPILSQTSLPPVVKWYLFWDLQNWTILTGNMKSWKLNISIFTTCILYKKKEWKHELASSGQRLFTFPLLASKIMHPLCAWQVFAIYSTILLFTWCYRVFAPLILPKPRSPFT